MTIELERYRRVNACETREELLEALDFCSYNGKIAGKSRVFDVEQMKKFAIAYLDGTISLSNVVTRSYGLRQQMIYIKTSEDFERLLNK